MGKSTPSYRDGQIYSRSRGRDLLYTIWVEFGTVSPQIREEAIPKVKAQVVAAMKTAKDKPRSRINVTN